MPGQAGGVHEPLHYRMVPRQPEQVPMTFLAPTTSWILSSGSGSAGGTTIATSCGLPASWGASRMIISNRFGRNRPNRRYMSPSGYQDLRSTRRCSTAAMQGWPWRWRAQGGGPLTRRRM